ncbi:hypothetical protein JD844_034198 [Phrynosoma platyrhinos]|uniref:Uncharacterized protein n=1 Tax=Phrynosoma platyrhinos TaxID=52577 RepID=A0ABQ7T8V6_PHRPL|nr:hypothetical protein JD844_034198 [Phrynosoma platyrhinos]
MERRWIQDSARSQTSLEDEKKEVDSQILSEEDPNNPPKEQPGVPLPPAPEVTFTHQAQNKAEEAEKEAMSSHPLQENEVMKSTVYELQPNEEPLDEAPSLQPTSEKETMASPPPPEQEAHLPQPPSGSPPETQPPKVPQSPDSQERPTLQWAPLPSLASDSELLNGSQSSSEEDLGFRWKALPREPSTRMIGEKSSVSLNKALRGKSPFRYDIPATKSSERETVLWTETKDLCKEGCFMRINSLSTQLRNRAFRYILRQLKTTRKNTGQNLSLLDQVLDLIDFSGGLGSSSFPKVPEQISNLWNRSDQDLGGTTPEMRTGMESLSFLPEQLEMKALSLTRNLAQELYTTYHNLLPHVPELPIHLQEKVTQVYDNLEELQAHLALAPSIRDLPSSLVLQSRQRITNARENLDEILDFMAQNPPSHWLLQKSVSKSGKEPLFLEGDKPPGGTESENNMAGGSSSFHTAHSLPPPPPHL